RRQHRLAIGESVHRGETGHPFDQGAEAGALAVGTVLAQPEMRTTTSFGLRARSVAGARPIFSKIPGRKLSMKIAADGTSSSSSPRASGRRNSKHRLFL